MTLLLVLRWRESRSLSVGVCASFHNGKLCFSFLIKMKHIKSYSNGKLSNLNTGLWMLTESLEASSGGWPWDGSLINNFINIQVSAIISHWERVWVWPVGCCAIIYTRQLKENYGAFQLMALDSDIVANCLHYLRRYNFCWLSAAGFFFCLSLLQRRLRAESLTVQCHVAGWQTQ